MKKNSTEYKIWIKHRNEKNLIRRTKKKAYIKARRTREIAYNTQIGTDYKYNKIERRVEFVAPLNFSFIDNAKETISFFNSLIGFISSDYNSKKRIYIDISKITHLTTDALMYLLAIVNNLHARFQNRFTFSGNSPLDSETRALFNASGFYNFVNVISSDPIEKNTDSVQIVSGDNSNNKLAKQLCDFVISKVNISRVKCSFLYIMMIELMSNAHKHAYNSDGNILYPRWYCFAEYKKADSVITFTFMDTGVGIPTTVRKNLAEKLDILKLRGENKYVISALNGDFRTSTEKHYRGKGLPKIREFCTENKIQNMRIITNKADVSVNQTNYTSQELDKPLKGTLFYWSVNLESLKGD